MFFLGGIPLQTASGYGMTGFGKDPTNPFTNSISTSSNYSNNRQAPLFEFNPGRLMLDPLNVEVLPTLGHPAPAYPPSLNLVPALIPGYLDSLGNSYVEPDIVHNVSGTVNFYAYFSAYGNGGYDPNDVNLAEYD